MSNTVLHILDSDDPEADVARAAAALEAGQLVVLPTETVYGVAARIDRPEALARLRAIRGESKKPWTLHLATPEQAWEFVEPLGDMPKRIVKKLWPGPVGCIFDVSAERRSVIAERFGVEPNDLFEQDTITLRCPDHPLFAEIAKRVFFAVGAHKNRRNRWLFTQRF